MALLFKIRTIENFSGILHLNELEQANHLTGILREATGCYESELHLEDTQLKSCVSVLSLISYYPNQGTIVAAIKYVSTALSIQIEVH